MPKLRVDAVLVQAMIAGALSFAHLHDLAAAAGQSGWKAWAYPISVDLLLVAAWRRLRMLRTDGAPVRAAWLWFAVALSASLGANIATAGLLDLDHVPDWLSILVAGWPALAFLGGTLLVHAPGHQTPAPAPESSETASVERAPAPEPTPDVVEAVEPAPALPASPSAPASVLPAVPAALVAHARKVADDHQARTGTAIDTDTLRVRLGVPAQLADAIAAQIT
ncbi:DUF2637 domain-containing protein [Actinacidiphila glaucinigra]|uniref:DUF2637 domain-containing protein n=1 Tax=Actinacidiphila glaucinigra TaxID=235986 RepID=UPI002E367761|nr:DUF2637 domain-containing protein [Actinacidiphila glaucinigra]